MGSTVSYCEQNEKGKKLRQATKDSRVVPAEQDGEAAHEEGAE